eukprot:7237652-Heterocapsa_arctica.AAC.1
MSASALAPVTAPASGPTITPPGVAEASPQVACRMCFQSSATPSPGPSARHARPWRIPPAVAT